jgi:hypothetical protein
MVIRELIRDIFDHPEQQLVGRTSDGSDGLAIIL